MQCEEFSTLLDDWKDGALSPEKQQQMAAHAKVCPRCQCLVQMQKDLASLFTAEDVPSGFGDTWHSVIRREKQNRIRKLQNALSAAAVLALTAGGAYITANSLRAQEEALDKQPAVMMARAMPAPEPSLWEKVLSFLGDAWPGILLLFSALAGLVFLIKRSKR